MKQIEEAARDILAVFMHPDDERYDEVLQAIIERLRKLRPLPRSGSRSGMR